MFQLNKFYNDYGIFPLAVRIYLLPLSGNAIENQSQSDWNRCALSPEISGLTGFCSTDWHRITNCSLAKLEQRGFTRCLNICSTNSRKFYMCEGKVIEGCVALAKIELCSVFIAGDLSKNRSLGCVVIFVFFCPTGISKQRLCFMGDDIKLLD